MLRTMARDFLAKECPTTYARAMMDDPRGYRDASLAEGSGSTPAMFGRRRGRIEASAADLRRGSILYYNYCAGCHGPGAVGGGSGVPDLRYLRAEQHGRFADTVLGGLREPMGMPRFDDQLSREDLIQLQAWILDQARIGHEAEKQ